MSVSTVRLTMPRRRWPAVVVVALLALFLLFTVLSGFVIDLLWYREIEQDGVFWTLLWTRVALGVMFGALFAGLLYANLLIARRIRPATRILTPEEQALERVRDVADPFLRWLVPLGSAILGVIVGIGASGRWQAFLLWRSGRGLAFGNPDRLFGLDPAYYVFTLPWLRFVQGWLFSALVGITILVAIAHVLWGGIRPQAPAFADKVVPAARAHLSVLLGLIMLVKAWGYWLGRYTLVTSERGVVQGASYTDVNAQLPALTFLTIVAVICALLFFANIRFRQWSLPIISVALLGLVSLLLGTAYPAFVQQFRVKPNEAQYEEEYIDRNIAATRVAFGLDRIGEVERGIGGPLTAAEIQANDPTVSNIRLWRGVPVLRENFRSQQRIRQYYDFLDVDVDRYEVSGRQRVLMVSPREITQSGITASGQTWQNRHLVYTHGFGAVAAPVNQSTLEGQPVFLLKDLPPVGEPVLEEPRIYYGESNDEPFVVTGSTVDELDYEGAPESPEYSGQGGIGLGNLLNRAMFAWRFRDLNLLISDTIDEDSKILIYRDIAERVPKAVPFLGFDDDPYFAVVDGRPTWIWDAYTYTDQYPYSQLLDVGEATDGLLGQGEINYLRNSVKAVVDAYDGTVTYYADTSEPILAAWSAVFPDLFTDFQTASDDMKNHFRYPENLLQVQAFHYANYHVTDANGFYQKRDFWQVPADPTESGTAPGKMRPYYQLLRLPGQETESFELVLPFTPEGRPNMVAWLGASSDPGRYGELTAYRFPEGQNVEGPGQVMSRINQDPVFSQQRTLLDAGGSAVQFGDFLVIPVEDSLLYVLPVYVRANQENAVPELKRVLVVNGSGGEVSIGESLTDAIAASVEGTVTPPPDGDGGGTGTDEERAQRLLQQAAVLFEEADAALRVGDLGLYQDKVRQAQDLVAEALSLLGGEEEPTTSPTPTPSPSPSPSG
jgi:uncharacterized membrane protein (UPF0182 family)